LLHCRFVDDGFILCKKSDVEHITSAFQNISGKIKYTFQTKDQEIEFLDLVIFKPDDFIRTGKLYTKVHQKENNPYLYIPFSSAHSRSSKKAFITTELIRYARNSTLLKDFLLIKKLFYQRLLKRGYPPDFLRPIFERIRHEYRHKALQPKLVNVQDYRPTVIKLRWTKHLEDLNISHSLRMLWKETLLKNEQLEELIGPAPIVCFLRHGPSLQQRLVRASFREPPSETHVS
jgi:hypothetical protein